MSVTDPTVTVTVSPRKARKAGQVLLMRSAQETAGRSGMSTEDKATRLTLAGQFATNAGFLFGHAATMVESGTESGPLDMAESVAVACGLFTPDTPEVPDTIPADWSDPTATAPGDVPAPASPLPILPGDSCAECGNAHPADHDPACSLHGNNVV